MAPKEMSKPRGSRVLPAAVLLLAVRLSLDASQAFVPQAPAQRVPAVGLKAEGGLVAVRDPARIKEQLLDAPSKALVVALEQAQEQTPHVNSLKDLEGTWEMRGPRASSAKGLAAGDLPRAVLSIYQGRLGRLLNMELLSPPRVTIAANGAVETLSRLRWGSQRDEIVLQTRLSLTSENTIQEAPVGIRSKALRGVKLPLLKSPRKLQVTYFDGSLLVLRDGRGITDVLWRRGAKDQDAESPASEAAAPSQEADAAPEPARLDVEAGSEADQLLAEVQRLKAQLETEREVAERQRVERSELEASVKRLDDELSAAAVKAKADSVKIGVMEELQAQVEESAKSQEEKRSEKARVREELASEVEALESEVAQLDSDLEKHQVREESLRQQIAMLEKNLREGPREEWPGYRAALDRARGELKDARGQIRSTKSVVLRLRKALGKKTREESQALPVVKAEADATEKLQAQLEEQQRELEEQRTSLTEKEAAEQALREELTAAKQQLDNLEAREAEGKRRAEEVEREIGDMVAQVDEAQKAAKGLGKDLKKRRFWPFGRR